ncbi:hypothetical protein K3G63_00215 [Hymenobacter sp. HSC-4F20]|uniref:hypothetical protein n=1 Tax=Hymenobacter sp. HSC-4F20 TaxID=2864135 RepID=UPI001C72DCC1|nr:hypothetical protein [Hymenobacter sp. HSC-4F20]MBX0288836.1 hypothetical protein [Hymenobacter sp. HSC-4F20]
MKEAFCILLLSVGLFVKAHAQRFQPGTFTLTDGTTGKGMLSYKEAGAWGPAKLIVKSESGSIKYEPDRVQEFQLAGHAYVREDNFPFKAVFDRRRPDPVFLEVVEKGPVELYAYHYTFQAGNYVSYVVLPVLRRQGTSAYVVLNVEKAPSLPKETRDPESVAALFEQDPELQYRCRSGNVTPENIVNYVHSYNAGLKLPGGMKATQ